jgi:hypothetical protein
MGEFVTVTAFRTEAVSEVLETIGRFFAEHGSRADQIDDSQPPTDDDVLIYPSAGGWTVVGWPGSFTELAAAEYISRELSVLASTVRIHDGDYWSHSLLRDGVFLDRFATMPDYFTDDPAEVARLTAKYAGRPVAVAEAVGLPVEQIAPYLVHVVTEDGEDEDGYYVTESETGKAFPDDEFDLDDAWVFVDFWRRLGIGYPSDVQAYATRLRLAPGWSGKLPAGDAEL